MPDDRHIAPDFERVGLRELSKARAFPKRATVGVYGVQISLTVTREFRVLPVFPHKRSTDLFSSGHFPPSCNTPLTVRFGCNDPPAFAYPLSFLSIVSTDVLTKIRKLENDLITRKSEFTVMYSCNKRVWGECRSKDSRQRNVVSSLLVLIRQVPRGLFKVVLQNVFRPMHQRRGVPADGTDFVVTAMTSSEPDTNTPLGCSSLSHPSWASPTYKKRDCARALR